MRYPNRGSEVMQYGRDSDDGDDDGGMMGYDPKSIDSGSYASSKRNENGLHTVIKTINVMSLQWLSM